MTTQQAKNRMKTIEKSIRDMQAAGFSVYPHDSILYMESPKTQKYNESVHSDDEKKDDYAIQFY